MTKKLTVYQQTQRLIKKEPNAVIHAMLECPFWLSELDVRVDYRRVSDDTSGEISVIFSTDGDSWIEVLSRLDPQEMTTMHRFRTMFGGGESLRTRNALLALALAIKLDNEERSQEHRRKIEDIKQDQ